MASVGSASRVDGVDLQVMVSAATAFARPQAGSAPKPADAEPDTKISSAGKLRSATSAVLDAAQRLNKPQTWTATTATSSDEQVVQAASDKAAAGDYSVSVDAMALAQTTASATFSSLSTVIGIGTLNIELGGWNTSQSTFATNPNWPKANVTIGPKDTSLERIRDKINAAGVGVVALVVSDATGSRLVLRSTSTGAANGFKVSTESADESDHKAAQALAALGFDPSAVSGGGSSLVQPAQDANVKIDGREVKSSQNLIEDDASGLSLRLNAAGKDKVNVHVETDTQSIKQDIQTFVSAYNDMASQLGAMASAPSDASTHAALDIQQRVQDAFKADSDPSALGNQLQTMGIQMNQQGQLEVDHNKLDAALQQGPARIEPLFVGGGQAGQHADGLAKRLQDIAAADAVNKAPSASVSAPQGTTDSATAAGALYRQKLLEQYALAASSATTGTDSAPSKSESELALPENAG